MPKVAHVWSENSIYLEGDMVKIEDQCKRLSDLVSFLCNTSAKKDNELQLQEMVKLAKEVPPTCQK